MTLRLLILLAGGAALVWSYTRWKTAVPLAMLLVVLEGALRKWVFPGAQDLIYFAKDVLLLGAYAGFLSQRRSRSVPRPAAVPASLRAALLAAAAFGLLETLNPRLPNVLVGLLGFKAYFLYVPLLWVLPACFRSDEELARFLSRYVLLAIPVGLLAVAQFLSPASSPLNTYAWATGDLTRISTFGSSSYVRVTGTFSYITGYSTYLLVMAFLVLAVLATTRWRLGLPDLRYFVALGVTVLGMLMTGSRAPVLILVLLFPVYWWLSVVREPGGVATVGRLLLALALVAGVLGYTASDAVGAFYGRAVGSEDVPSRALAPLTQPVRLLDRAGPIGYGIGATHQAASAVTKGVVPYSWLRGPLVEGETGRIMLELGPVGFLLIYFIRTYLVLLAFRHARRLRTRFHRAVATASLLFLVSQLLGAIVFNVTADVYYWFFGGLLFLVMRLDREVAPVPAERAAAARRRPALPAHGYAVASRSRRG